MKSDYNKTLLIVEDETLIALGEQKELERYGYNVLIVNTGEKAVSTIKEKPDIDLILMDIDLGSGIDGTVAADQILQEHEIPIVFMFSHTDPEVVGKTEKITSYGYVVKSSGITVLDASIKMAFKLFEAYKKIYINEIKQNTMMLNIADVISIIDENGKIRYKSGNPEKHFDWQFGDLEGSDYLDTIFPDDRERIQLNFSKLLETDYSSTTVEFRYKCKDGSFKPVELTATNLIKDPEINGILVNFHDITEKMKAENLLRSRESLLVAFINALPDRSLIYDEEGKYIDILPSENSLLYAPSEILLGKTIYDILPEKIASEIHKVIKDTII